MNSFARGGEPGREALTMNLIRRQIPGLFGRSDFDDRLIWVFLDAMFNAAMSCTAALPAMAERISLRRLREEDLPRFQSYRHDPIVGRYQGWTPTSDDDARSFLIQMNSAPAFSVGEWFQLAIADRQSDLLIGDIGVCVSGDGSEAELGFTLSRESQGRGLAYEAVQLSIGVVFAATAVCRIVAITDARNAAAIKLLLALGLKYTGSKNALFRNEACIERTYTILRGSAV